MSKFFQQKFGFSNTEAGTAASIPYLIASLSVPILGSLLLRVGESKYALGVFWSLCILLASHSCYLLLPDNLDMKWLVLSPIVMFGFGHAMFTTVLSPNVPMIIKNNSELLPVCFSIMKVAEGVMITVFT